MNAIFHVAGSILPIFGHPFMRNAFLAGTCIAACCGAVGYFGYGVAGWSKDGKYVLLVGSRLADTPGP